MIRRQLLSKIPQFLGLSLLGLGAAGKPNSLAQRVFDET